MSDYRPDSELMRLCQTAVRRWVKVSPELFYVLWHAQKLAKQTDGAFDITVGPLTARCGVRRARKQKLPDDATLQQALESAQSWQRAAAAPRRRRAAAGLAVRGRVWAWAAVAKGYACDCALRVLRHAPRIRALVQTGAIWRSPHLRPTKKAWPDRRLPPLSSGEACAPGAGGLCPLHFRAPGGLRGGYDGVQLRPYCRPPRQAGTAPPADAGERQSAIRNRSGQPCGAYCTLPRCRRRGRCTDPQHLYPGRGERGIRRTGSVSKIFLDQTVSRYTVAGRWNLQRRCSAHHATRISVMARPVIARAASSQVPAGKPRYGSGTAG